MNKHQIVSILSGVLSVQKYLITQTRIRSKLYGEITKAMVELVMMNISRRVVKIMVENVINNILFMNIDE